MGHDESWLLAFEVDCELALALVSDRQQFSLLVIGTPDHGHACGSGSVHNATDCLGKNPGGTLGTAQANPCCWLAPIGPQLASCQAPHIILWDDASNSGHFPLNKRTDWSMSLLDTGGQSFALMLMLVHPLQSMNVM